MKWEEKKGGRCAYVGLYRVWVMRERFKPRGAFVWQVQRCGTLGQLTYCAHGLHRTMRGAKAVALGVVSELRRYQP